VNDENLISLGDRPKAERIAIARKGGLSRSPKKSYAQRLRFLKKKGLTNENYKRLVDWMEQPDSSVLDILLYIESIKNKCNNATQMNNVARSLIDLHKAHHGDKIKTENVHHHIDWNEVINGCRITEEDLQDEEDST